jgi:hypothetical protein
MNIPSTEARSNVFQTEAGHIFDDNIDKNHAKIIV